MKTIRPAPNDPFPVPDLYAELERLLEQIPRGRVTTYGALGKALGEVRAARWIATFLLDREVPERLPAHRVLLQCGALGEYFTGSSSAELSNRKSNGFVRSVSTTLFTVTVRRHVGSLNQQWDAV